MSTSVVELPLFPEQRAVLEPVVRNSSRKRRNVIFLATASPQFAEGRHSWVFQVMSIPANLGPKILRIVKQGEHGANQ